MNLKDFDYHLPKSLIAQKPIRPRDHSRLLVVSRRGAINAAHSNKNNVFRRGTANSAHSNSKNKEIKIEHKHFYDIIDYLRPGDVLVLNNSKVFPARLIGRKAETGGRIEVFLLGQDSLLFSPLSRGRVTSSSSFTRRRDNNFPPLAKSLPRTGYGGRGRVGREVWSCLLGGHGRKEGLKVEFGKGLKAEVIRNNQDGIWLVKFNMPYKKMMRVVEKIGQTPLSPYIKRSSKLKALRQSWLRPPKAGPPWAEIRPWRKSSKLNRDILSYQTIYADENRVGSVAAPTAGFHFTKELLEKIKNGN